MMDVGSRVRVTDGEHHGKSGEIVRIAMHGDDKTLRVRPVVLLKDGTEAEISGAHLTVIR